MSKEKIEALYDVIVKHKGPIMDIADKELTKDEFVDGYIKAREKDRKEIIEGFKNEIPKDTLYGFGGVIGRETNATRKNAIDAAVADANKEADLRNQDMAADRARSSSLDDGEYMASMFSTADEKREAVLEKDKILRIKGKAINTLKAAAKQVIEANRKEKGLEGKKTTFADVTINASKNQRDREDSFMTYVGAGNLDKARHMLFDGDHPMTVTPKFVAAMEANNPDSPALKFLYERQLKTELDKKIVGTTASRETIEALAEKVSPGKIEDVKINEEPMLTYVALNNPNIIDRVARIEGVSSKNKSDALIAVANRSESRADYNAALDLVANGAKAAASDLTIPIKALPAIANDIGNLVEISHLASGELNAAKKTDARQQVFDLETKNQQMRDAEKRKDIHKGAKAGGKYVADGAVKYGTIGAKGAAALAGGVVLGTGAALGGLAVGAASLAGAGYNAASAGMKKYQPLKKTGMAIAASPAAIAAGVQLVTTQALSMAYYNVGKIKNSTVSGLKDIGAALNIPKNLLASYRSSKLDSKEKTVNNYLSDIMESRFEAERNEAKKAIIENGIIKKNTPEYKAAKQEMDDALLNTQAPLREKLKVIQEKHDLNIAKLASGRHEDEYGMFITKQNVIQDRIKEDMISMAKEKASFLSALPSVGLSEKDLRKENQTLKTTTESVQRNVIKNFKIKFGHENRLNEEASFKDTTQLAYDRKLKDNYKSAKGTFNYIINAEKSAANWVASLLPERKAKVEEVEQVINSASTTPAAPTRTSPVRAASAPSELSFSEEGSVSSEMASLSPGRGNDSIASGDSVLSRMKNMIIKPNSSALTAANLKNHNSKSDLLMNDSDNRSDTTELPQPSHRNSDASRASSNTVALSDIPVSKVTGKDAEKPKTMYQQLQDRINNKGKRTRIQ